MAEPAKPAMSSLEASFADHMRAFHQSLPPAEQSMLERLLALADAASGADVTGFSMVAGSGMTKGFYLWMKDSFERGTTQR